MKVIEMRWLSECCIVFVVYDGYPVDMFNSPEWDFMDQGDQYHHEAETGC